MISTPAGMTREAWALVCGAAGWLAVADGSAVSAVGVEASVGSTVAGCGVSVSMGAGSSVSVAVSVGASVGNSVCVVSCEILEEGSEAAWASITPSRLKPMRPATRLIATMKFKNPARLIKDVIFLISYPLIYDKDLSQPGRSWLVLTWPGAA